MLTKLLPEQVTRYWDILKPAIEESLPPVVDEAPDKMNRILAALIGGSLHCWVSSQIKNEKRILEGVVVTKMLFDDVSDTKSLLIYCLYGYNIISSNGWKSGFATLAKWAKSRGCSRIVAYSDVPRILDIVGKLGGDTRYRYISFPLNSVQLSNEG